LRGDIDVRVRFESIVSIESIDANQSCGVITNISKTNQLEPCEYCIWTSKRRCTDQSIANIDIILSLQIIYLKKLF